MARPGTPFEPLAAAALPPKAFTAVGCWFIWECPGRAASSSGAASSARLARSRPKSLGTADAGEGPPTSARMLLWLLFPLIVAGLRGWQPWAIQPRHDMTHSGSGFELVEEVCLTWDLDLSCRPSLFPSVVPRDREAVVACCRTQSFSPSLKFAIASRRLRDRHLGFCKGARLAPSG